MATTDIVFSGLQYLNGVEVSVCIAGLDCGDYFVGQGQITVPITSNPALSAQFLSTVSAAALDAPNVTGISIAGTWYFVPVVIGRKYTSTGQMLRPLTQADVRSQTGDALGKIRQGFQYSFLFSKTGMGIGGVGAGQFAVGTSFDLVNTAWPLNLRQKSNALWTGISGYNGVHWDHLQDVASFDAQLTWSVSRPVGVTIEASAIHLHSEDR